MQDNMDKDGTQKVASPNDPSISIDDLDAKSVSPITPVQVDTGTNSSAHTAEELLKLYSESSKEGKRLHALTKEQEAKIRELEHTVDELSTKYQEVEPWVKALENQEFVKYISNYDPQKGSANDTNVSNSATYGLGDSFEDFEPRDMFSPDTPSGKFFADVVSKQVKSVLNKELSVRDQQLEQRERQKQSALELERQINDFVRENPHITREEVEATLEAAKNRPFTLADIYYTVNRDKINEEIRRSTLNELQDKRSRVSATPYPLISGASDDANGKREPGDRMYDMLSKNLNVMGIVPEPT